MYENHRDSFGRDRDDLRSDDRGARWRRAEERYRREAQSGDDRSDNRFDDDGYEASRRNRDLGYGRTSYGGGDWHENRSYGQKDFYGSQDYDRRPSWRGEHWQGEHWHERDHEHRAGHPYSGTYGGTGDSSYFTGQQGSWAVGEPRTSNYYGRGSGYGYGGQRLGADYRSHGYAGARYDDGRRGFWDRASDEVASWFGDDAAARRREEDHRGAGPKDYKRSDERVREDVNDRLTEDWRVDAGNVTVTVKDGEVTLNGTVTSREAKRRAEDVADAVSGTKHVQNNLRVQEATGGGTFSNDWATNRTSIAQGGAPSQPQSQSGTAKL